MKVYICEKPSLARALFLGLGGTEDAIKSQSRNGVYSVGDHYVTYCVGHILELLDPEDHDPKYKEWDLNLLPFRFPPKLKIIDGFHKQFNLINDLLKKSDIAFNVGDPDEAGQRLIDEVLEYAKYNKPVKRIFISDYNITEVKKNILAASDNKPHMKNGDYDFARSISDQLFGYNFTRAYTLAAKKAGYSGVLNVGRVQTGIVNLIHERCLMVDNHKESFYYNLIGEFRFNDIVFPAKYMPTENDLINDKNQIINSDYIKELSNKVINQPAVISSANHKNKNKSAPSPYTMATLQADCARKFGVSAQNVLDAAQALYENNKAITYPRTNCSYLGTEHFKDKDKVIYAIFKTNPIFSRFKDVVTSDTPHACFNSNKVEAHHGIIPTASAVDFNKLSQLEQQVYNLVARRYLGVVSHNSTYAVSDIFLKIADLQFSVKSETILSQGWEALYSNDLDNPDLELSDSVNLPLSELRENQKGLCFNADIQKKKAPSPKYFVDSTLIRELTHIAKYVDDPELREQMNLFFKEKNVPAELGTEATRAGVIEKVFSSGLAEKVKVKGYKELAMKTTDIGKTFIELLPDGCKKVDVTANWVKMGISIKDGSMSVTEYVDAVYEFIKEQVNHVKSNGIDLKVKLDKCPQCNDGFLALKTFGSSSFFGCTNYPHCTASFSEYKGKPYTQKHLCPDCSKPLILRSGKGDYFFGCSGYKDGCKKSMGCVGGRPAEKTYPKKKNKFSLKRKAIKK